MQDSPELNPALDAGALATTFCARGRVHIPAILTAPSAARVAKCLEQETRYNLSVSSPTEHRDIGYDVIAGKAAAWRAQFLEKILQGPASHPDPRQGFQAFYDNHRMSDAGEPYHDPAHYLAAIVAFLNGAPFLQFARTVTGIGDIAMADAQATRFVRNQFLTTHDDKSEHHGKNRRAAYVLNMTENWRADWGGLLLFLDAGGNVTEGFVPAFNALNILAVPQLHLVSQVTGFAGRARHSITGWLNAV